MKNHGVKNHGMNNQLLKRPQLVRLGNSTCQMLTFKDMVDGVVKECLREESPTVTVKVKVASRPRENSLGESTNQLLDFQEMMESPVKISNHSRLRLQKHRPRSGVDRSHSLNVGTNTVTHAMKRELPKVVAYEVFTSRPAPIRVVRRNRSLQPVPSATLGRSKTWPRVLMDVAPGLSVQLCGTEESVEAFHHHRVNETVCSSCDIFLYCIDSADMVLCPICRSISHVEVESSNNSTNNTYTTETLGMGLTVDQVFGN